jgi:hypothetical protein
VKKNKDHKKTNLSFGVRFDSGDFGLVLPVPHDDGKVIIAPCGV